MKKRWILAFLLAALAAIAPSLIQAQSYGERSSGAQTSPGTSQRGGAESSSGMTMPTYSFEQKDRYEQQVETRLQSIKNQVERLEDQKNLTPSQKQQLEQIESQEKTARQRLEDVRSASRDDWNTAQARMNAALNQLETSFNELQQTGAIPGTGTGTSGSMQRSSPGSGTEGTTSGPSGSR